MHKISSRILLLMAVFIALFNAHELNGYENFSEIFHDSSDREQHQEFSCCVAPQDLFVDREVISVNIDGMFYPVHSLEKSGGNWIARLDLSNNANYCPLGHLTCKGCGQCHKERCRYFVKYCRLWN